MAGAVADGYSKLRGKQSKAEANYRLATVPTQRCRVCEYFNKEDKSCEIVAGNVSPGAVCDNFVAGAA